METSGCTPLFLPVYFLLLPGSGPAIWCLNSYWLEDEVVQGECRTGITNYWRDNLGKVDPSTEWDTFKTTLRGTFMSITGVLCKNNRMLTEELETVMVHAESAYASNPASDTSKAWLQSRREYELRLLDLMQKRMLHATQKSFEHGNKAGLLLAYLIRPDNSPISIPRILTAQGPISDNPGDILDSFLCFYKDLYTSRVDYDDSQLNDYLANISLPSLSTEGREVLDGTYLG